MITLALGLLLVSCVSGLPAPHPEADPDPAPLAEPDPAPLPEPDPAALADPEADPFFYGGPELYPYGGVIEEILPPIFIEGIYEEVIVGPEYGGYGALYG